jgi:hypothetical protein
LTEDRFGSADSAYSFDGIDDRIEIHRSAIDGYSLSVWLKTNESNNGSKAYEGKHIVSNENNGSNDPQIGNDVYLTVLNEKIAFGGFDKNSRLNSHSL